MALGRSTAKNFGIIKQLAYVLLRYFDPAKLVKVSVDANSKEMGADLMQDDHPVAHASRTLTRLSKQCSNRKRC